MPPYTVTDDPDRSPELQDRYIPTLDEEAAIRLVTNRFQEAEEARRALDEVWLQCVAFTQGKQWHRYDWASGTLQLPKAPSWRIRAVHNLIRPKVAQAAAAMVADLPLLDVEPMSTQEQDILAARTGKHVLEYLHERLRWERLYISLARWVVMCGTGFIKTFWDPGQQDLIARPALPQGLEALSAFPLAEEAAPDSVRGMLAQVGQIGTTFCSPFEMYPQPGVQAFVDCEWVIHAKARTLDYIRQRYPEKGRFVGKESETATSGFLERRVADLMEGGTSSPVLRKQGSAVVLEYWEKPCPQYPQGRQITVANGVVLRMRALPYRHLIERRCLPFTAFLYEPLELRVWGMGLVEDLIPLQREYNRILSDLLGILKTTGMPRILWPVECGPHTTAPTSQPGQIIRYLASGAAGAGIKPEHWHAAGVGGEWLNMLDRIKADMEDVANRHQVSAGTTPTGVTAGVSIQLLQEADNRAFGPIVSLFHESLGEHGQQALALAKEFYNEQRLAQVTGDEDERQLLAFSGSDLPDYADVRAVAASKIPMSRAAKMQQLFDLYDRGVFGQPGTPPANVTLLKRLEFGDVEQLAEEQIAYQQQQQMQAMQMQAMQAEQQAALQAQQGSQQQALEAQKAGQAADLEAQRAEQAQAAQQAGHEGAVEMEMVRRMLQPAPETPKGARGLPR